MTDNDNEPDHLDLPTFFKIVGWMVGTTALLVFLSTGFAEHYFDLGYAYVLGLFQ